MWKFVILDFRGHFHKVWQHDKIITAWKWEKNFSENRKMEALIKIYNMISSLLRSWSKLNQQGKNVKDNFHHKLDLDGIELRKYVLLKGITTKLKICGVLDVSYMSSFSVRLKRNVWGARIFKKNNVSYLKAIHAIHKALRPEI